MEHAVQTDARDYPGRFRGCCCETPDCSAMGGSRCGKRSSASGSASPGSSTLNTCETFPWADRDRTTAGEALGIIGDNRPEWVYAELARAGARTRPLRIFQDAIIGELAYIIDHSGRPFVVAEDQEQVDKILGLKRSFRA